MSDSKKPIPVEVDPRKKIIADDEYPEEGTSRYRQMLATFGGNIRSDRDAQLEFLQQLKPIRLEDITLCLGYWFLWCRVYRDLDQSAILARTGVYDKEGRMLEKPFSRGYPSLVLSGLSRARPDTWKRFADAMDISPVEFYIADGWLSPADVLSFQIDGSIQYRAVVDALEKVPEKSRNRAAAFIVAALGTIASMQ